MNPSHLKDQIVLSWETLGFPRIDYNANRRIAKLIREECHRRITWQHVRDILKTYRRDEAYTYDETLHLIDSFIREAGVRVFCSETCEGKCCRKRLCHDPCIATGVRRLGCVAFICRSLRDHIFTEAGATALFELESYCAIILSCAYRHRIVNLYYFPYEPAVCARSVFSKSKMDTFLQRVQDGFRASSADTGINPATITIY